MAEISIELHFIPKGHYTNKYESIVILFMHVQIDNDQNICRHYTDMNELLKCQSRSTVSLGPP